MYEKLIQQILETKVKAYLKGLLTTTELSLELDQRELYKIYGLLLSACRIKVDKDKHSMFHEVSYFSCFCCSFHLRKLLGSMV